MLKAKEMFTNLNEFVEVFRAEKQRVKIVFVANEYCIDMKVSQLKKKSS